MPLAEVIQDAKDIKRIDAVSASQPNSGAAAKKSIYDEEFDDDEDDEDYEEDYDEDQFMDESAHSSDEDEED